ncbi:hypothetical protein BEP19_03115 [Ammoniphilus oxalaticus]|uniref:Uncharacterized protein n=1 Tax=Ammoniphilus oxalaticus TaxID=66863 RepID=A0A419SNY7_9BACL|nr:hypothetical protein [Ammoniphilus oxalaticus]RKD25931.1 hypothetical protein BEP19_03115 [Ammoniphilus oxalaticus]
MHAFLKFAVITIFIVMFMFAFIKDFKRWDHGRISLIGLIMETLLAIGLIAFIIGIFLASPVIKVLGIFIVLIGAIVRTLRMASKETK